MTMIKLDDGSHINPAFVVMLEGDMVWLQGVGGRKITPTDCDRIVATMNTKDSQSIYIDAGKLADTELNDLTRKQRGLSDD